jgi:hypothetical protein
VLTPDRAGKLIRAVRLGPGQAFGVSALMGHETGSVLRAMVPMHLLVVRETQIAGSPEVNTVAEPGRAAIAPAGGERLSQVRLPASPADRFPPG